MKTHPFIRSAGQSAPKRTGRLHGKARAFQIAIASVVGATLLATGHCQTYQFSVPISGAVTLGAQDRAGWTTTTCTNSIVVNPSNPLVLNFCGILLNFQTLTETIYFDPINLTLRQVGTISIAPSATNFVIHEYTAVPPGIIKTADIFMEYSLLPSGFSFDTGIRPLTYDAVHNVYTCDGSLIPEPVTVRGSYSIVTSNQTQSGTIDYVMSRYPSTYADIFVTFNTVSMADYPTSLALSGAGQGDPVSPPGFIASPQLITDFTATNGFHTLLYAGAVSWYGNKAEEGVWSVAPVMATNAGPVFPPIQITGQPQSVVAHAYDGVSFTVTAYGAQPLHYQWSLNGTNIAGATGSTLAVPKVQQADLGEYVVVLTNVFGANTSSPATLGMYPLILTPFTGAVAYWGKYTILSVQAWGTEPLSYQWFKDGAVIPGATTNKLTLESVQFTNAGLYSLVVSNSSGSATNPPAQVVVNPAGISLGFSPTVTIEGVPGYTYLIERTDDLTDTNSWLGLTNLTLTEPVQRWADTDVDALVPNDSKYFYRVLPGQ